MKTNRRNFIKGAGALAVAVLAKLQTRGIVTAEEQAPAIESTPVLSDIGEQQASAVRAFPVFGNLTAGTMSCSCGFDFFVSYGTCVNPGLPITYRDARLVNHDPVSGAYTFEYGEATNEV